MSGTTTPIEARRRSFQPCVSEELWRRSSTIEERRGRGAGRGGGAARQARPASRTKRAETRPAKQQQKRENRQESNCRDNVEPPPLRLSFSPSRHHAKPVEITHCVPQRLTQVQPLTLCGGPPPTTPADRCWRRWCYGVHGGWASNRGFATRECPTVLVVLVIDSSSSSMFPRPQRRSRRRRSCRCTASLVSSARVICLSSCASICRFVATQAPASHTLHATRPTSHFSSCHTASLGVSLQDAKRFARTHCDAARPC